MRIPLARMGRLSLPALWEALMPKHIPSFKINQIVEGRKIDCASGWATRRCAKAMLKGLRLARPNLRYELEDEI